MVTPQGIPQDLHDWGTLVGGSQGTWVPILVLPLTLFLSLGKSLPTLSLRLLTYKSEKTLERDSTIPAILQAPYSRLVLSQTSPFWRLDTCFCVPSQGSSLAMSWQVETGHRSWAETFLGIWGLVGLVGPPAWQPWVKFLMSSRTEWSEQLSGGHIAVPSRYLDSEGKDLELYDEVASTCLTESLGRLNEILYAKHFAHCERSTNTCSYYFLSSCISTIYFL